MRGLNNIGSTPFKVNQDLLSFILSEKGKGLAINENDFVQFNNIENLSKYKIAKYKCLQSKFVLQEFILNIANLYKNFNSIYFPVKLDHRGRLYCIPAYFNYQSSDLAKALILFSMAGIINKNNLDGIKYLKAYGVHCFGGDISKGSLASKERWVDENLDNIVNYDNGILVNKAKEKLLFIAFCIEYKRFNLFLNDENLIEFSTYLAIQLDATCNGFKHLSLLSQESQLYDELNLTNKGKYPKHFYNFLLHKVHTYLKDELDANRVEQGKGSILRLNNFIFTRSHVKKVIMTIPYNSTERSMREYLKSELEPEEYDNDIKSYWYISKHGDL